MTVQIESPDGDLMSTNDAIYSDLAYDISKAIQRYNMYKEDRNDNEYGILIFKNKSWTIRVFEEGD